MIATPPEEVFSHADRRRQSEVRLGRNLRSRVRLETEEGEEELSVISGNDVEFEEVEGYEDPRAAIEALLQRERPPEENRRRRLEQRRDQAVDEAIRRLGISAERRPEGEGQQVDQTPDDPNVVAEIINPEGAGALNRP